MSKISGYPPTPTAIYSAAVRARFLAKVRMIPGGCWLWMAGRTGPTGTDRRGGYGSFWDGHRMRAAHLVSYEMFVGPIPPGLTLDHLCRVRHCVSPADLEPVTRTENTRRIDHRRRGEPR